MGTVYQYSNFPTTRWTLVERLSHGEKSIRLQGWDDFVSSYWSILVGWMQSRGIARAEAEDLVQGLMQKLWKTKNLEQRFDSNKIRLRTYLLAALQNWWRDEYRKEQRLKRGGEQEFVSYSDSDDIATNETGDGDFDQGWALATVRRACVRLRQEYVERKNEVFFDQGFQLIGNPDESGRRALEESLGVSANSLTVSLKRLRERLIVRVRAEVEATLVSPSDEEVRDEVRHLLTALASAGGLSAVMPTRTDRSQDLE